MELESGGPRTIAVIDHIARPNIPLISADALWRRIRLALSASGALQAPTFPSGSPPSCAYSCAFAPSMPTDSRLAQDMATSIFANFINRFSSLL